MQKKGNKSKEVDPTIKNKMVLIRMSGELFNRLSRASYKENTSINKICISTIENYLQREEQS